MLDKVIPNGIPPYPSFPDPEFFHADTVQLSDAHLLNGSSQADYLLEFLLHLKCRRLIIAGDFFDFWEAAKKKTWEPKPTERMIVETILKMQKDGTKIEFIPGNHEEELRKSSILNKSFFGISVVPSVQDDHSKTTHGDEYDEFVSVWGRSVHATAKFLGLNGLYHKALRAYNSFWKWAQQSESISYLGQYMPQISLARRITREAESKGIPRQETRALHKIQRRVLADMEMRSMRFRYIGHTHTPNEIHVRDPETGKVKQTLIDLGDWIENQSFAADGKLKHWETERKLFGLSGAASHDRYVEDEKIQDEADRLFRILYRLQPGYGRKQGLTQLSEHIAKREERLERAALYREFAQAVGNVKNIGEHLKEHLCEEFNRIAGKCDDIAMKLANFDGKETKKSKEERTKLAWHKEIKKALGAVLDGSLEDIDRLSNAFIRKAERLEAKAEKSEQSAQKIRDRLKQYRTFKRVKTAQPVLPALANAA